MTLVGAIISQRVYEDVVQGGYTQLHETEFEPVTAEVHDKGFAQSAWLYVPRRSHHATDSEPVRRTTAQKSSEPTPAATSAVFHGNVGQNITANQISDGVHLDLPEWFFDSRRSKEQES
ncbi:hypothetical protein [Planotetraspora kaengkrachanensis]|uniref:hypothetical protein n=1 Tax=Planotetraspora kaengkrachanensis TaxID=575193 RepID=UPI001940FB51|nr:hypothetical protein [Planotetraspora kaengkrachanensis]